MDKFPGPVAVVSIESEGGFGGDFRGRFRPPEVSQCLKFPRPPDLSACQAPRPLADLNSFPSHFAHCPLAAWLAVLTYTARLNGYLIISLEGGLNSEATVKLRRRVHLRLPVEFAYTIII
jgi:hypothetical protein